MTESHERPTRDPQTPHSTAGNPTGNSQLFAHGMQTHRGTITPGVAGVHAASFQAAAPHQTANTAGQAAGAAGSTYGQMPVSYPPAATASIAMAGTMAGTIPVDAAQSGAPAVRYRAPKWKAPARHSVTFYFAIALLLSIGVAGLMLMRPYLTTLGTGVTLGLILLALLPVVVIVSFVTWIDNWEPEPIPLYIVAFIWGAGVSTILSLFFNEFFDAAAAAMVGDMGSEVLTTVVGAPLIEEGFKGLGVLVLLFAFSKNFNGPVDGIVYGMLIGLGFAFTENILYFSQYYEDLALVFRSRAILNPFVHPLATAMTGLFVGLSVQQRSRASLFYLAPTGYVIAVGLHALHNLSAVLRVSATTRLMFQIPIYLVMIGIIIWARVSERREVMAALGEYAKAGWLTTNELSMIQSLPNRRQAVFWARDTVAHAGGDPEDGVDAMKRFQAELIELGYARSRALHHGDVNLASKRQEEAERLELLGQLRRVFTGKHAAGIA